MLGSLRGSSLRRWEGSVWSCDNVHWPHCVCRFIEKVDRLTGVVFFPTCIVKHPVEAQIYYWVFVLQFDGSSDFVNTIKML